MREIIRRENTILTNNVAQSKILAHGLLLEDMFLFQKRRITVAYQQNSKSLLGAQENDD